MGICKSPCSEQEWFAFGDVQDRILRVLLEEMLIKHLPIPVQKKVLEQEPPTVEQSREGELDLGTVVPDHEIEEVAGTKLQEFKDTVMGEHYVPGQKKGGCLHT